MAFWNRDDEGGEWEKYQKSKEKGEGPAETEKSSAGDEFKSYFKTVRLSQPTENEGGSGGREPITEAAKGMLNHFIASFKSDGPEENAPEEAPEQCPWCGKTARKGYLAGGRGVYWTDKKPGFLSGGLLSGTGILDEGGLMSDSYKVCWFCQDCRKLFFDTAKLEPPLGVETLPDSTPDTMSDAERKAYVQGVMSGMSDEEKIAYAQAREAQEETKEGES